MENPTLQSIECDWYYKQDKLDETSKKVWYWRKYSRSVQKLIKGKFGRTQGEIQTYVKRMEQNDLSDSNKVIFQIERQEYFVQFEHGQFIQRRVNAEHDGLYRLVEYRPVKVKDGQMKKRKLSDSDDQDRDKKREKHAQKFDDSVILKDTLETSKSVKDDSKTDDILEKNQITESELESNIVDNP